MLVIPSTSKEYLHVPVSGAAGTEPVDIAIVSAGTEEPATTDWHAAVWDGTTAKLLIGPGALALADGLYRVWVRVTATPEVPVIRSGLLKIT